MANKARLAALTVLERCRRNQAFSDNLIGSVADSAGLEGRDRALCSRLSYGVLQNSMLCDFYIDSYLSGTKKLEPKLRDILRLSVYQLLFMDRIPDHAAINEAVELCKELGLKRASGLANAVLRKISSNKDNLPEIPRDDMAKYLSIKYSHPISLAQLFIDELGEKEAENLMAADNTKTPIYIQVNTLKSSTDELLDSFKNSDIECEIHPFIPNCLILSDCGDITKLSEFKEGKFYVQDPAAKSAVLVLAPKAGDSLLDACAAPGGKSFASAIYMENKGSILSCDVHSNKLHLIDEGAERLGIDIIETMPMDARMPNEELKGRFDCIIADVPCSGLGVIRKKPDIRYKDVEALKSLPEKQLEILLSLADLLKQGGTLLYSTCTILKRENQEVIKKFLEKRKDFSLDTMELNGIDIPENSVGVTLYPHLHNTDGFYICKLRKQ